MSSIKVLLSTRWIWPSTLAFEANLLQPNLLSLFIALFFHFLAYYGLYWLTYLLYICTHFYGRLNSSGLMTLAFLPEDHISHLVFLITTQMSLFKQQKLFVTTRLRLYELHIWPNYVVDIFSRVLLLSNMGYVHSFAFG